MSSAIYLLSNYKSNQMHVTDKVLENSIIVSFQ